MRKLCSKYPSKVGFYELLRVKYFPKLADFGRWAHAGRHAPLPKSAEYPISYFLFFQGLNDIVFVTDQPNGKVPEF
jgi:hypothetical protein